MLTLELDRDAVDLGTHVSFERDSFQLEGDSGYFSNESFMVLEPYS